MSCNGQNVAKLQGKIMWTYTYKAIMLVSAFALGVGAHAAWETASSSNLSTPSLAGEVSAQHMDEPIDGQRVERNTNATTTTPTTSTQNTTDVNVMQPLVEHARAGILADVKAANEAPVVTRVPIPENWDDVVELILAEGAPIAQHTLDALEAKRNAPNPDAQEIADEEAYIREVLTEHLRVQTFVDHDAINRANNTGLYRYKAPMESFLGPEKATVCADDNATCTPPLTVSLLCDMSQAITCQTLARAIRMSDKLFLLYPFETTPEMLAEDPDLTLIYGRFPGQGKRHRLYIASETTILDNTIEFNYSKHTGQYSPDHSRPREIVSPIMTSAETIKNDIHETLGLK
jgi:hypothetical protein